MRLPCPPIFPTNKCTNRSDIVLNFGVDKLVRCARSLRSSVDRLDFLDTLDWPCSQCQLLLRQFFFASTDRFSRLVSNADSIRMLSMGTSHFGLIERAAEAMERNRTTKRIMLVQTFKDPLLTTGDLPDSVINRVLPTIVWVLHAKPWTLCVCVWFSFS